MITETPMQPVKVDYVCDACNTGHMRSTGEHLTSNPPIYPHRCDNCGEFKSFNRCYPYITYKEVTQ